MPITASFIAVLAALVGLPRGPAPGKVFISASAPACDIGRQGGDFQLTRSVIFGAWDLPTGKSPEK